MPAPEDEAHETAPPTSGPWRSGPLPERPSSLPSLALSLATLAAVGVSITLLAISLALPTGERADFLVRNVLGAKPRRGLLAILLWGACAPVFAAAAVRLFRRLPWPQTVASLERLATLLAPLSVAFVVPLLFIWKFAQSKTTYYLVLLCAFVLVARALLTRSLKLAFQLEAPDWLRRLRASRTTQSLRPMRGSGAMAFGVVVLGALGYAAFAGHYSIVRHQLILTTAFDLGIYDNLLYNALHGRYFNSPVLFGPGDFNYLAGHAEYAMMLFVPLYALHPKPETLLWLQAAMLGGAAIPFFMFARRFLSPGPSMIVSLGYLLFAPLHGPNFYDFHWLPITIFFYFWLFYALAARKNWLAVPMVLVLFATREDVAVGLLLLGAFLFLSGARVRFGLVLAIVSALWFGINKFVIMPWAGTWWFQNIYAELFADGVEGYGSVIITLLTNPGFALTTMLREAKLAYALHMLAPLAFLPVRKPVLMLLMVPGIFFSLLTTAYPPTLSIGFQYTAHFIPYLFLALVISLWLFENEADAKPRFYAAVITMSIALLSHSYSFGAILQGESVSGGFGKVQLEPMTKAQRTRYAELQKVLALIPPQASVAASEFMNPHISSRLDAYVFRYKVGPVDYVFFSNKEIGGLRNALNDLFREHKYGLVSTAGGEFYLFKRGIDSATTQKALKTLGLSAHAKK